MPENTLLATPAATAPIKYLDRAMATLRSLGLAAPQDNNAPAIALVSQLSTLDQGRVVAIARVLQQSGHFNAVMRDEISSAKVSDRYTEIIRAFDSIRDDASTMVEQVRDGKIDMRAPAEPVDEGHPRRHPESVREDPPYVPGRQPRFGRAAAA